MMSLESNHRDEKAPASVSHYFGGIQQHTMIRRNITALFACIFVAFIVARWPSYPTTSLVLFRRCHHHYCPHTTATFGDIISPKLAQEFHLSPASATMFVRAFNTTISPWEVDCGTDKTATTNETSANSTSVPSKTDGTEISIVSSSNSAPSTNLKFTKARASYTTASVLESEDQMAEDIYSYGLESLEEIPIDIVEDDGCSLMPIIYKIARPYHRAVLFYLEYCHYHGRDRFKTSIGINRLSKDARAYLWSNSRLELRRLSARINNEKTSNKLSISTKDIRVFSEPANHQVDEECPIDNSPVASTVQIFVCHLNGNTLCLDVKFFDSIADVKVMIYDKLCIPVNDQALVYGGRLLENDRTLFDYNIQKESTIHLSLRLRGGSHHDESNPSGSRNSRRRALYDVSNISQHFNAKRSRRQSPRELPLSENALSSCSVDMPSHIIEKQKSAINGIFNVDARMFIQRARGGWNLIVLGLYPISNDYEGKIGTTEKHMLNILDPAIFPEKKCTWVDFCVMSSTTANKRINQYVIQKWVDDDELVKDYYRRLLIYLNQQEDSFCPCVYVAGSTCQKTLDKAVNMGLVKRIRVLSATFGVHLCEMDNIKFVTLEERPHPSAHLMKGNAPAASGVFRETMKILNAIGRCCTDIYAGEFEETIMNELKIDTDELRKREEGRVFMTQFLYGDASGRFPPKHKHLRHIEAHDPAIQILLIQFRQKYGMKVVLSILNSSDLYTDLLGHSPMLQYWLDVLGRDKFVTFITGCVACRLYDDNFLDRLHYWLDVLGRDKFVTLITGCVACRLNDDNFLDRLHYWLYILGPKRFITFINGCVACRIHDDNFLDRLHYWLYILGPKRFVSFMVSGTAIAFCNDDAYRRVFQLYEEVGYQIHTLMHGGIGSHLHNEVTFENLIKWLRVLGKDKFVKIFGKRTVVCHLVKASQFDLFERLFYQCKENTHLLYAMLCLDRMKGFRQHFITK